jgi:protein-arginine kinase activator protein McsA
MKCPITGKNCTKYKCFAILHGKSGKTEGYLVCEDCMHQNNNSIIAPNNDQHCDRCGISLSEIIKGSRFGCPHCYDSFPDALPYIVASVQMTNQEVKHTGRMPTRFVMENSKSTTKQDFMNELSEVIKKAAEKENYTEAAKIKKILDNFSRIPDEERRDARSMNELALFIFKFRSGDLEGLY